MPRDDLPDLFADPASPSPDPAAEPAGEATRAAQPLAARMRPRTLAEIAGQEHLTKPDGLLARLISSNRFGSLVFYGPPGCGKTSFAEVIARVTGSRFVRVNAVMSNVASAANAAWEQAWAVNVMAHVYSARAALPGMIERKSGWFLNTASAAGLLTQIGSAIYSTTKHAAVGFAESLAITHKNDGIGVSVLCPQAVDTPMLGGARGSQSVDGVLSAEEVAESVVEGLAAETFLILPHPQVLEYMRRKTGDYDRWLRGMVRLRQSVLDGTRG